MRLSGIVTGLLLLSSLRAAFATELPQFDVRLHCASLAGLNCQAEEKAARSRIQAQWMGFPEQRQHFCVQSERFLPRQQQSYVNLARCLADDKVTS